MVKGWWPHFKGFIFSPLFGKALPAPAVELSSFLWLSAIWERGGLVGGGAEAALTAYFYMASQNPPLNDGKYLWKFSEVWNLLWLGCYVSTPVLFFFPFPFFFFCSLFSLFLLLKKKCLKLSATSAGLLQITYQQHKGCFVMLDSRCLAFSG